MPFKGQGTYTDQLCLPDEQASTMTATMPRWLQAHLEATGVANTDGFTRAARPGRCRSCGARVLRGLDADRLALPATVDTAPLDAPAEVVALLAGRVTYDVFGPRPAIQLAVRNPLRIAGRRNRPVLVDHRCGETTHSSGNANSVAS